MKQPLLSIVITTKNRKETLLYSVKTALSVDWEEMELIIQDCSDNDDAENLIKSSYKDNRLKYFRSPSGISMTENWNRAIENVSGKYLSIIGDDDGILPTIKDITIWANENNIKLISDKHTPRYFWPNYPIKSKASNLYKSSIPDGKIVAYNAEESLSIASYDKGSSDWTLPMIYHGITAISVLREVKKNTGEYFSTYNPDFYATYACLNYVVKHYKINLSFTVVGASQSSNTATNTKVVTDHPHFKDYKKYEWVDIFPDVKIFNTVCAETRYKAFRDNNRQDLNENLDIIKLYAVTTSRYLPSFFINLSKLQTVFKIKGIDPIGGNIRYSFSLVKRILYTLISDKTGSNFWELRKKNNKPKLATNNIYEACIKYQKEINNKAYLEFREALIRDE